MTQINSPQHPWYWLATLAVSVVMVSLLLNYLSLPFMKTSGLPALAKQGINLVIVAGNLWLILALLKRHLTTIVVYTFYTALVGLGILGITSYWVLTSPIEQLIFLLPICGLFFIAALFSSFSGWKMYRQVTREH